MTSNLKQLENEVDLIISELEKDLSYTIPKTEIEIDLGFSVTQRKFLKRRLLKLIINHLRLG